MSLKIYSILLHRVTRLTRKIIITGAIIDGIMTIIMTGTKMTKILVIMTGIMEITIVIITRTAGKIMIGTMANKIVKIMIGIMAITMGKIIRGRITVTMGGIKAIIIDMTARMADKMI